VQPFGCAEGAGRLGRALLGLPKYGHRLGEPGEPDDQRDLADRPIAADEREGRE